jgi:hypothetical protein
LIASDRNPRRWEDGTRPVSGPAWVALEYMLREAGEVALAEQVAEIIKQRRIASAQRSSANRQPADAGARGQQAAGRR